MLENSKVYLWDGYVFPCEDVVQVVDYVGNHLWLPDVPEEEFDEESSGYRVVQDYPMPEHVRVYDSISKEWHWLDDFDTVLAYEYHNGNSWQIITFPENEAVKVEVILENRVLLDQWDGRNMTTGGVGRHAVIYPIIDIDDERVSGTYLLLQWSQFSGVLDTGEIVPTEFLPDKLQELDRDWKDYESEFENTAWVKLQQLRDWFKVHYNLNAHVEVRFHQPEIMFGNKTENMKKLENALLPQSDKVKRNNLSGHGFAINISKDIPSLYVTLYYED